MACIGENTMLDLLERRVPEARRAAIHAHLELCTRCREMVAAAANALTYDDTSIDPATQIDTAAGRSVAPPPLPTMDLAPGAMVDHYQIVSLLDKGGMGQVYAARDTTLDRAVALKLIKPELIDHEKAYKMFTTEARATARLNHPNIVTIHGVGRYRGLPYVALEMLVGKTLRKRMKEGQVQPPAAVRIGRAIAEALGAAHEQSVFHRDLKPANVMLCDDGTTRVLDFGLATIADAELTAAREAASGTPAYMAPEQWFAEPATGATDVWALGVILFEMCTGSRPYDKLFDDAPDFTMHLLDLASAVRSDSEVPVAEALEAARVPEALGELIARCLAKVSFERPTAKEVARALHRMELEMTVSAMSLPLPASVEPRAHARAPSARRWMLVAVLAPPLIGGALAVVLLGRTPTPQLARTGLAVPLLAVPIPAPAAGPTTTSSASGAPSAAPPPKPWDPMSYR